MSEELFELPSDYDGMLNRGLRLSGESKEYFARGRIAMLRRLLPDAGAIRDILDFGCGVGATTPLLAAAFPSARILGLDSAQGAIDHARQHHADERTRFGLFEGASLDQTFDLCYVNGVFHHIPPPQRADVIRFLHKAIRPDGYFAWFENNPWNPGTRMVMKRIPFDRDAQTISIPHASRVLRAGGFSVQRRRSIFFFPRWLSWLRWLEPILAPTPLGGQYIVLARRTSTPRNERPPC